MAGSKQGGSVMSWGKHDWGWWLLVGLLALAYPIFRVK